MKTILKIISFAGLSLTVIPSILVLYGVIDIQTNFVLMAVGMFIFFGSAPFWMKSKPLEEDGNE
jgi:hypothetical protein